MADNELPFEAPKAPDPVLNQYRYEIEMFETKPGEQPEKVARVAATVSASNFTEALPKLAVELQAGWERILTMGPLVDQDLSQEDSEPSE